MNVKRFCVTLLFITDRIPPQNLLVLEVIVRIVAVACIRVLVAVILVGFIVMHQQLHLAKKFIKVV